MDLLNMFGQFEMKKKICMIHKVQNLDPRSFYKESRTLSNAGYEVTLLGLFNGSKVVNGIKIIGFNSPYKRLVRFFISNYQIFVTALREKSDVYHFHDLDFIPFAVLLKILTRSKILYDIHEAYPEYMLLKTYLPIYFRIILYLLIYMIEHAAIRFFDAIIPNDNFIAKNFKHKNKIVIFNFPTLDFFKNEQKMSIHEKKYDLFYHGSLPTYHFETMMKIAEKLNSENVKNIWGIVTNDNSTLCLAKKELEIKKLEGNFFFLKYVDYLKVIEYLNMAKIGIIPLPPFKKFYKNIPLKMFEFMGAGEPIVLSDLPPSRQFIQGENCAIAVEPNNIDEYVNAIKDLLNNPDKIAIMGNNGKKLVFEKYNWNNEGKKLLNLYDILLYKKKE